MVLLSCLPASPLPCYNLPLFTYQPKFIAVNANANVNVNVNVGHWALQAKPPMAFQNISKNKTKNKQTNKNHNKIKGERTTTTKTLLWPVRCWHLLSGSYLPSDLTYRLLSTFHSVTPAFFCIWNASNICSLASFCPGSSHSIGDSVVALMASLLPSLRGFKGHLLWEVSDHPTNHCPSPPCLLAFSVTSPCFLCL